MSDTNKHFKFDLDKKAESFIKIWTTFLDMVTKWPNRKKQLVSAIFLMYSIFSNRNQTSLFSGKVKWLKWLEKRWGAHARWWAIAISQLTELNIKANPPCFQYAHARQRAKWRHNLWAERMCKRKSTTVGKTHYYWMTKARGGGEKGYSLWWPIWRGSAQKGYLFQASGI